MKASERQQLLARVRQWFEEDQQVAHYGAEAPSGPTAAEARLLQALPAEGHVLDLGCGAGRIAFTLLDHGYQVTGVEISERLLSLARAGAAERHLRIRLAAVDPLTLPFTSMAFDAAIAIKTYGYLPSRAARLDYLAEVGRVLRPGAPLLLTSYIVPTEAAAREALEGDEQHRETAAAFTSLESLDTFSAGRGYVHWFTPSALLDELHASPLVVENVFEDEPGGLQRLIHLRRPP